MELQARGASFIAQTKESNPLDLVKAVIAKYPSADRKERFLEFERRLFGDEDRERAVRWYFFVNMHDYITTSRSAHRSAAHRANARAQREAAIAEVAGTIKKQLVLMDLVLPTNGKLLRDSKFADCAKAQGWWGKVAKMGKPNQIVGKVLTEEDLRKLR